jgi:hypothetical protein
MKYELLAIDVDGTLIGADQSVVPESVDAIAAAEGAGVRVCLATGRALTETLPAWSQLRLRRPYEPLVVLGGAMVCEPDTRRTLYCRAIEPATVERFGDALVAMGCSAVAAVDRWRSGLDYCVAPCGDAEAIDRAWLRKMGLKVRRVRRLAEAAAVGECMRLNAVAGAQDPEAVARRLREQFDGSLTVRAIRAPNLGVTLVEAFAPGVDKFAAIRYVAQAYRITPARIAAVGDDVNDVGTLRGAGLGVAMPGATAPALAAADHVARDGLAAFIRRLLAGHFDLIK